MAQLILARGTTYRKNLLNRIERHFHPGPYFLMGSLIVFVVLTTVLTLMFSARQLTKGYVLNSLEFQNQELIKASERSDMEISKVRSLNFIESSSKVSHMVRPAQVVFVEGESAIASR